MAGLLRAKMPAASEEVEFRDGMHGLLVWALATLLTALIGLAIAGSLPRLSPSSGGAAKPAKLERRRISGPSEGAADDDS